jgi:glycerol-3-phosphate acyltransferase PlsY
MNLLLVLPFNDNNYSLYFVSFVIGFILGSIPFGYLIARIKKVDIRTTGSKNIGFTNVLRTLGVWFAIPVLVLDIAKGFLPTFFANDLSLMPILVGLGGVLGHMFTPWLGLKGGKGVATTIGIMMVLAPKALLLSIFIFLIVFFIFSYVSLAALGFAIFLPISVLILYQGQNLLLISIVVIAAMIIIRHKDNITRLIRKTESKTSILHILKNHL